MMEQERTVLDGWLYSNSMVYLPTTYRASVLAQMEVLRRARGYRARWYVTPEDSDEPVVAFSQVEYQVRVQPGSYLWGITFAAPFGETVDADDEDVDPAKFIHVQVTDACTETPLLSDYARGSHFAGFASFGSVASQVKTSRRAPVMIMPRLIGDPGLLDVEIYNGASVDVRCQLVLLVAEPCVPYGEMRDLIEKAGMAGIL